MRQSQDKMTARTGMRWLLGVWLLTMAVPTGLFAGERPAPADSAFLLPVAARDTVWVGDRIRYGCLLEDVPEGALLRLPDMRTLCATPPPVDSLSGEVASVDVEFMGDWHLDTIRVSKWWERPARHAVRAYVELAAFSPGRLALPPLSVQVGEDTLALCAPTPLEVFDPPVDAAHFTPPDIRGQARVPLTFREVFPFFSGVVLLDVLVGLLVWALSRRRVRRAESGPAGPVVPPAEVALRTLRGWRERERWMGEAQKAAYTAVTEILREYLSAHYGFGAMEMTTEEILRCLSRQADLVEGEYDDLEGIFRRADDVKFARREFSCEESADVAPRAIRFVEASWQRELARRKALEAKEQEQEEE